MIQEHVVLVEVGFGLNFLSGEANITNATLYINYFKRAKCLFKDSTSSK